MERYSAAWQQFLIGRKNILSRYDAAFAHAKEQPVVTHHGNVGEAAVRDWLATFLPKRFGVTSGYVRSQGIPDAKLSSHFDVIVYDQIEAPVLWVETNPDKSGGGHSRIVPAEYVLAVIEVKAAFNGRSVDEACAKLSQLAPFLDGVDQPGQRYPKYFPASAVCAMLFMELRRGDQGDRRALTVIRDFRLSRGFYGAVIFRGEGQGDATALISQTVSNDSMNELWPEAGLLSDLAMTESIEVDGHHKGIILKWTDLNFSDFAFDLLALLKGTYRHGYASSMHGLDFKGLV
jgi:hypothetical protein